MKEMLHILSVGSANPPNTLRDAFLQRGHCHLAVAANSREMFAIPIQDRLDIAILSQITSPRELQASCEHIRRSWPAAKILVVCPKNESLDDPLYDEWLFPDPSLKVLFAAIERLAAIGRHSNR